jgi:putative intracellular protease/amidase
VTKPKAHFLIFDGLADWEAAHALCEINKSRRYDVIATGLTEKPVKTMAGLTIEPDATISAIAPEETAIFILPGGDMWEKRSNARVIDVLRRLRRAKVPIAAACAATLEVARAGLTRGIRHTSNSKSYLAANVSGYSDGDFYVDELAVSDDNIITTSGLGCVEFALEIVTTLGLYNGVEARVYYDMFKHGVFSARAIA